MLVRSDWMLKSYDFAILFLENFKICAFLKSLSILPLDEPVSIGLSLCEWNVSVAGTECWVRYVIYITISVFKFKIYRNLRLAGHCDMNRSGLSPLPM